MSEYDKELDSRTNEWEKARGPLQGNESTVQRPDDTGRNTAEEHSENDQERAPDRSSK